MAESGFAVSNRGVLTALRAAAVVIIATGLNDVIAGAVPRYEPLYVYLGAIALVAWLDGIILGALTAIVAVAFYALLFMPRGAMLTPALLVPAGAAIAVVLVVGVVRGIVRARRRVPEPPRAIFTSDPPLLPPPPVIADNTEVLDAIDALRSELRTAIADRTGERELRAAATERIAELERLLQTARTRIGEVEQSLADVRIARDLALAENHSRIGDLEGTLTTRNAELSALRTRIARLEEALAEAHGTRQTRVTELEQLLRSREADASSLRARTVALETALAQAHASRDTHVAEIEKALAAARTAHEQSLGARDAEAAALRARIRELETAVADGESTRDADASRSRARIAELESALADARALHEQSLAARDAEASSLHTRITELEAALADAQASSQQSLAARDARIAELESALADARALREQSLAARDAETSSLHTRITELEAALADAQASREQSLAARDARVAELESALADARALHEQSLAARDTEASSLHTRNTEMEAALADAQASSEQSLAARDARIAELESTLAATSAEFDQKLGTIVAHLAEDHEADLGKALEEKEEARAEARSIAMRNVALQKKVDEERHRVEDLTRLLDETRRAAQEEIDSLRAQQHKPAAPATRPRILVAHPDADLRMNARASLERAGYEIVSAADGLEALRTAIAQKPDVVIADAIMPKMNGRELCQLLKSQEKTAHIRVILLLRATDEPPKGDLVPDEVLRKPVPLETLKHTLAALLAARAV